MATNASWHNHSECAGEYIEAISVNMGLHSASVGCPIMGDLHSEHLVPERIRIVTNSEALSAHLSHLFIIYRGYLWVLAHGSVYVLCFFGQAIDKVDP